MMSPSVDYEAVRPGADRPTGLGRTRPPRHRIATATRESLMAKLDRSRGTALTIVQSPAGFGKTVLLAQWFDRLRADDALRVAWLTLDENDREVTRFVADVGATLAGAGLPIPGDCLSQARSFADVAHRRTMICDAIDDRRGPVILFMDDYHRAASPEVDRFVEQMIRSDGGDLQIVLATRDRVALRVADLEAQGLVHRIGSQELVLTLGDTRTLFGAGLPEPVLIALHDRTEGWAVALQLARLWLDHDPARADEVSAFSGRTDVLARYLVERVLEDVDDDARAFLTETALLGTFDAATADAIRGTDGSHALLSRLAPFDALLVPLDPDRRWFRYHQLFAEFLGDHLEHRAPGRSVVLHTAAADHFLRTGDIGRSVAHACRAGDVGRGVAAVDRAGGWEIVLQHGIGFARGLLGHFGALDLEEQPVLLRMRGYLQMKDGALGEARRCIDAAAETDATPGGRRDGIIVDALLRTYADDLLDDEWAARVESDLAALDAGDAIGRGTLRAALAVHAIGRGDFASAERESCAGVQEMEAAASVLGEAYCRFHRSRGRLLTGRLDLAEAELRDVLADVERRHGGERALKIIGSGLLGAVLLARGDRDEEAQALLAMALSGIEAHDSWLDVLATTYEAGLRQTLIVGDIDRARSLLRRAEDVARDRSLGQLTGLVTAWRIEALVAAGELQEAALLVGECPPATGWRVRYAMGMAMAQFALQAGRSAEALRSLRAARAVAVMQGRLPDLLRIDLLIAATCRVRGDRDAMTAAAAAVLTNPCVETAPGMLRGLAVDVQPVLAAVIRDEGAGALAAPLKSVARRLRKMIEPPVAVATGLSAREFAVLSALCEGSSNKEIGRRLDLTENTVKFHLKNLYGKLGAKTRTAAVNAALSRGLIHR